MAESKNIKDLPVTDAMVIGDYFLIETPAGTQLIDFENFVIDQDNTTFAADLITNVDTLSTTTEIVSASVDINNEDSSLNIVKRELESTIGALTSSLYGDPDATDIESQLNLELPLNPETLEERDSSSQLAVLSGKIFDDYYARIKRLEETVLGGEIPFGNRSELDFAYNPIDGQVVSDDNQNLQNNKGGWLGVLYDTLANQNPNLIVHTGTCTFSLQNTAASGDPPVEEPRVASVNLNIDNDFDINASNLIISNVQFASGTNTDKNILDDPGVFVVNSFAPVDVGLTSTEYQWNIRRCGGGTTTDTIAGNNDITINYIIVAQRNTIVLNSIS